MTFLAILTTLASVCGAQVPYSAPDSSYSEVLGLNDGQLCRYYAWSGDGTDDGVGVPIWMDDAEQYERVKERERQDLEDGHCGAR